MKQVVLAILLLAIVSGPGTAFAGANAGRQEQLAKEREKLEDEKDPVDRAKINIKISEILLASVSDSIRAEDFSKMNDELNQYAASIEDAHNSLITSGRDASKKAGGFKDLEIALRKHVLRFDDLGRAVTLDRRQPLEKAKKLASTLRDGLLKALFR